jgi:hypothetical protein
MSRRPTQGSALLAILKKSTLKIGGNIPNINTKITIIFV